MINILNEFKFKEVILLIKKYKKMIIITFIFSMVVALSTYALPIINMKIIDNGIMQRDIKSLIFYISTYFIILGCGSILNVFARRNDCIVNNTIELDLKTIIIDYLISLKGGEYGNYNSGEIDAIIKGDITVVISLILSIPIDVVINIICLFLSIGVMLKIDIKLSLIIMFTQIINMILRKKFNSKIESNAIRQRNSYSRVNNLLNEIINNIRNIRLLNAKEYNSKRYKEKIKENQSFVLNTTTLNEILKQSVYLIENLSNCLVLFLGGIWVIEGKMSVGGLITIMQYSAKFTSPVSSLIGLTTNIRSSKLQILNITSILEKIREENKDCSKTEIREVNKIKVRDLKFSYGDNIILNGASLELKKGEINYIIGKSGSGKTTFTKILMGEYQIGKNVIFFSDGDISDIKNINEYITWIPQEPIIFNDTIYNNLVLSKIIDNNKLIEVCEKCRVMEFVNNLKNKFDHIITEKGSNLSVGQKQRIAIARALLQETPIIIIDEPTASLDKETESILMNNIKEYIDKKIVVIITHNKNIIDRNSQVFELKNNKIIKRNLDNI